MPSASAIRSMSSIAEVFNPLLLPRMIRRDGSSRSRAWGAVTGRNARAPWGLAAARSLRVHSRVSWSEKTLPRSSTT